VKNSLSTLLRCLALVLLVSLSSGAQNQHLYLVSGLPTPKLPITVPSLAWQLDAGELKSVAELAPASEGNNFVVIDHERRLIVAGMPNLQPTRLVVLNMDAPAQPRIIPVSLPGVIIDAMFLGGTILGIMTGQPGTGLAELTGLDVTRGGPAAPIPWDSYKNVRREGWWEPSDTYTGDFPLRIIDGKAVSNRRNVQIDITLPKQMVIEPQAFSLLVNTDEMLVLDRPQPGEKGPWAPQVKRCLKSSTTTQKWSSETFAGGGSSVRAFGHWLAINEADIKRDITASIIERKLDERESPGRAQRQRVLNPQASTREQASIDTLFADSQVVFAGSARLLDIRTGKRYDLFTGHGDTEVLLIDQATVYYRVNDALVRAQLGRDSIENTVVLLRDDRIPLVHWAFLAP
jgi:hypothetical protein